MDHEWLIIVAIDVRLYAGEDVGAAHEIAGAFLTEGLVIRVLPSQWVHGLNLLDFLENKSRQSPPYIDA